MHTFASTMFTFVSTVFSFVSTVFSFVSTVLTFVSTVFTFDSIVFTFVSTVAMDSELSPNIFVHFCVRCAISNGAGGIGALILLAQGGSVGQ